jgi:peroxiredoxin
VQLRGIILFGLTLAFAAAAAEPGTQAPGFTATTFEGKQVSLADYRGKIVFVDFWASWCSPCRESLPLYDKLAADFGADDFAVIAVNLDETAADAKKFIAQHPVRYTIVQNPQGDIPKMFGVAGMPSSYLIDRDGTIRQRHIGFDKKDVDMLRAEVTKLLGKPAGAS